MRESTTNNLKNQQKTQLDDHEINWENTNIDYTRLLFSIVFAIPVAIAMSSLLAMSWSSALISFAAMLPWLVSECVSYDEDEGERNNTDAAIVIISVVPKNNNS